MCDGLALAQLPAVNTARYGNRYRRYLPAVNLSLPSLNQLVWFCTDHAAKRVFLSTSFPHLKNFHNHFTTTDAGDATMADELQSKVIEDNPIGTGLDAFRSSFNSICESRSISTQEDALIQLGEEGMANQLCHIWLF